MTALAEPYEVLTSLEEASMTFPSKRTIVRLRDLLPFLRRMDFTAKDTEQDRIIYWYYECSQLNESGQLNFGITKITPGVIGQHYHFTRGHFHANPNAGEVYLTAKGEGILLTQNRTGKTKEINLKAGSIAYISPGWAHRAVNTGDRDLVYFYTYPADAGHDYSLGERDGFKKIVVRRNGMPTVATAE
jgi:glucose-6-phosphate isomerase